MQRFTAVLEDPVAYTLNAAGKGAGGLRRAAGLVKLGHPTAATI